MNLKKSNPELYFDVKVHDSDYFVDCCTKIIEIIYKIVSIYVAEFCRKGFSLKIIGS